MDNDHEKALLREIRITTLNEGNKLSIEVSRILIYGSGAALAALLSVTSSEVWNGPSTFLIIAAFGFSLSASCSLLNLIQVSRTLGALSELANAILKEAPTDEIRKDIKQFRTRQRLLLWTAAVAAGVSMAASIIHVAVDQ